MPPQTPLRIVLQPTRPRRMPWLFVIVLMAALLRLIDLGGLPPSVFRDEAEKGLTAWSLLSTGKDLEGKPWPLFINAFGVTTSAIYQYGAIPFLAVLGPSDFALRLPAAVAGVLAVALVPWAFAAFGRRPLLLFVALALAFSPWNVPLSRWAQQGSFLPVLFLVMFGGLSRLGRGGSLGAVVFGAACAGLAVYTYDPARLLVPVFLLGWAVVRRKALVAAPLQALAVAAVLLVTCLPTVLLVLNQTEAAQARFRAISVFSLPWRDAAWLAMENYFQHFGPGFLLMSGDGEPRHGAGGVLGWLIGLGFYFGLVSSWRAGVRRRRLLLLWMVILTPMAAALTREGIPHALRTQAGSPFFVLLGLLGWKDLFQIGRRALGRGGARLFRSDWAYFPHLVAALILVNSLPFLGNYFGGYGRRSAFHWQYGVREGLEQTRDLRAQGVRVVGCMIVGGKVLGGWYGLQEAGRGEPRAQVSYPITEGPFGVSPAELDSTNQVGAAAAYLAVPGLAPIPGGLKLPIWYQGRGSADGKNPTLVELHLNPQAMQLLKSGRGSGGTGSETVNP